MDNNTLKKNIELVKTESAKLYQEIIDNGYSEKIAQQISDELSNKGGLYLQWVLAPLASDC